MKKIFISGSISIKELPIQVVDLINNYIKAQSQFLIGDAYGTDQLVQKVLVLNKYNNATIFGLYERPRIMLSNAFDYKQVSSDSKAPERERQQVKDTEMTNLSDISIVIWNGKSNGSFNNILRALSMKKEVIIFLDGVKLSPELVNVDYVTSIFNQRHEYSLSEYLQVLKKEHNNKIKTTKQMLDVLIKNNVVKEDGSYEFNNTDISTHFIHGKKILKYKQSLLQRFFPENESAQTTYL